MPSGAVCLLKTVSLNSSRVRRRKQPKEHFCMRDAHAAFVIEVQCGDSGPADWRHADEFVIPKVKMIRPTITSRVKHGNGRSSFWIGRRNPIALAKIAARTSPGEVVQLRETTVDAWNDMLD